MPFIPEKAVPLSSSEVCCLKAKMKPLDGGVTCTLLTKRILVGASEKQLVKTAFLPGSRIYSLIPGRSCPAQFTRRTNESLVTLA